VATAALDKAWAEQVAATELLAAEGLAGLMVHRVEQVEHDLWWIAYERRGRAWTAIFAGARPKEWALLRTMEGWPVR
jgi:hypothetical protein